MKRIIFRADGDAISGMGHIYRCLSLIQILSPFFRTLFAVKSPSADVKQLIGKYTPDLLEIPGELDTAQEVSFLLGRTMPEDCIVLDGYTFDELYQDTLQAAGRKTVFIDDVPRFRYNVNAIINHAEGIEPRQYKLEKKTALFLGVRYAILRNEFLEAAKKQRKIEGVHSVFINMGGADPLHLSLKMAKAALRSERFEQVHVILGIANKQESLFKELQKQQARLRISVNFSASEMVACMSACQLAIVPASGISLEVCSVGMACLCGYYVENQKSIYQGLAQKELIFPLGDLSALSENQLIKEIDLCISAREKIQEKISLQKRYIDGDSSKRLVTIFENL